MASSPRIALIGMHIESNAFAPVTTGDDFRASCYLVEDEIVAEAARPAPAMPAEIPGFVDEMNRAGAWEPAPILVAATEPGGPVDHGFFTATIDEMRSRLARRLPLDAVYVSNHGAMISTGSLDADGELYRMVRDVVGPRVPVVAAVDLHANISDEMVASTDAIISYRTNPHVDQAERAAEAARLLLRMLDGRTLAPAILRLPIVAPTVTLLTARGPYADLIAAGQAASGVDVVSVVGGFAYSDTPKNGLAILAYGDRAPKVARDLARQAWADRERFQARLTPLSEAVEAALSAGREAMIPAVCLSDVADNPGGGGRGNTTKNLEALMAADAAGALLGLFIDPALAKQIHTAGEGAEIEAAFNPEFIATVPPPNSPPSPSARACPHLFGGAADEAAVKLGVGVAFAADDEHAARAVETEVAAGLGVGRDGEQAGKAADARFTGDDGPIPVHTAGEKTHAVDRRRVGNGHEGVRAAFEDTPGEHRCLARREARHHRLEVALDDGRPAVDSAPVDAGGLVGLDDDEPGPVASPALPQLRANRGSEPAHPGLHEGVAGPIAGGELAHRFVDQHRVALHDVARNFQVTLV